MTSRFTIGALGVFITLCAASSAGADERGPWFSRWLKGKGQQRALRICRALQNVAGIDLPTGRDGVEELARDAWFSLIEFKETLVSGRPQEHDSLAGDTARSYLERGRVRASRGEYDRAVSDFNACLRSAPDNALAFFARALAWGEKREYYRGIRDLDRGLRIEPRLAEAYRIRGMYWLTLNNADRALADFDKFVRLDGSGRAHFCRALAWIQKSKMSRAKRDLGQAVRLAPKEVTYLFVLGGVRLSTGDELGAIDAFNRALELSPELADAYVGRALAWGRRGNRAKAAADMALAGDTAAARRLAERPASRGCIVQVWIKAEGTSLKFRLNWRNPVANYARGEKSADSSRDAKRSVEEDDALDRFRRAVGSPRLGFDEYQSSSTPANSLLGSPDSISKPVENGGYPGGQSVKRDAHYLEGLEPRVRQRADELNQRAWLLATSRYPSLRDGIRAVEAAREACELTQWKDAPCLDTLAAAYAECGDFESADKHQTRALELWPAKLPGRRSAERRLQRYRDRQPLESDGE